MAQVDRWLSGLADTGRASMTAPVALTVSATAVFCVLRLPVSDLQAASARAEAVHAGVGPGYWFAWFGGEVPGRYSLITAWLCAQFGTMITAAVAAIVLVALLKPLLAGLQVSRAAGWLATGLILISTYSGRVAFGVGAALAVGALVLLRRGRGWQAGLINAAAAFASPLAAAFALLGVAGFLLTWASGRHALLRYCLVTVAGLAVAPALFTAPGPTPLDTATFLKVMVILLAPQLLRMPRQLRISLCLATLVAVFCYVYPAGVGANISRYALYVMPPVVAACSLSRPRWTALALTPALLYCAGLFAIDVTAATAASAQHRYYLGLEATVAALPELHGYRLEALDTPTHRASRELATYTNLARGWDLQADAANNPLFYRSGADLTAPTYQTWLDQLAVRWVAVPDDLNAHNRAEAALIRSGLPYLRAVWSDPHWTLYEVQSPQRIVATPASMVAATESSLVISVPPGVEQVMLRLRPSPYLRVAALGDSPASARIHAVTATTVELTVAGPGEYRVFAKVGISALAHTVLQGSYR